jgi:hypothetical protein
MKLTVHQAVAQDIYRDYIRVPEQYRQDRRGRTIREGTIVRVAVVGARTGYGIARGSDLDQPTVRLDEKNRNDLAVEADRDYEFYLSKANPFGKLRWALWASDAGYQWAARLAICSLALGLISLIPTAASIINRMVASEHTLGPTQEIVDRAVIERSMYVHQDSCVQDFQDGQRIAAAIADPSLQKRYLQAARFMTHMDVILDREMWVKNCIYQREIYYRVGLGIAR